MTDNSVKYTAELTLQSFNFLKHKDTVIVTLKTSKSIMWKKVNSFIIALYFRLNGYQRMFLKEPLHPQFERRDAVNHC